MPGDKEQRYEDILRKIAGRRPFGAPRQDDRPATPHDQALDLVNAYDSLDRLASRDYPRVLCHGPKTLRRSAWSGVVMWYRDKGYHGYQLLRLLGIWARYKDGDIWLALGLRELKYRAPIFDAGVYKVAIANNFQLYYHDDGRPPTPDERILFEARFALPERLRIRDGLGDSLMAWAREMDAG